MNSKDRDLTPAQQRKAAQERVAAKRARANKARDAKRAAQKNEEKKKQAEKPPRSILRGIAQARGGKGGGRSDSGGTSKFGKGW